MPQTHFGHIPGVAEGMLFRTRLDLMRAGVHRQLQPGISGSAAVGADCIIYNDAYEDNVDLGDTIYYAGEGCRSQETGRQVADQAPTGRNKALLKSLELNLPIRVVRQVATDQGHQYRYDGLYKITDFVVSKGLSGYKILLFKFRKIYSA